MCGSTKLTLLDQKVSCDEVVDKHRRLFNIPPAV